MGEKQYQRDTKQINGPQELRTQDHTKYEQVKHRGFFQSGISILSDTVVVCDIAFVKTCETLHNKRVNLAFCKLKGHLGGHKNLWMKCKLWRNNLTVANITTNLTEDGREKWYQTKQFFKCME